MFSKKDVDTLATCCYNSIINKNEQFNRKACEMKKTNYKVIITQDNAHVERRVWTNENGIEVVSINGNWYELDWCYIHFDAVYRWNEA